MSTNTRPDQERTDESPTVEEIAVRSTVELLYDRHREACDPVTSIGAGLRSTVYDGDYIVSDEPTVDDVRLTASRLRELAEFLEERVVPLIEE